MPAQKEQPDNSNNGQTNTMQHIHCNVPIRVNHSQDGEEIQMKQVAYGNDIKASSNTFDYPFVIIWIRILLQQKKNKNKPSSKEKNRSGHATHEFPNIVQGIFLRTKIRMQHSIHKMPLQHHQNGIGTEYINKDYSLSGGSSNSIDCAKI